MNKYRECPENGCSGCSETANITDLGIKPLQTRHGSTGKHNKPKALAPHDILLWKLNEQIANILGVDSSLYPVDSHRVLDCVQRIKDSISPEKLKQLIRDQFINTSC